MLPIGIEALISKYTGETAVKLRALRPLLADTYSASSTQVRNLDKQVGRPQALGPYRMAG